MQNQPQTLSYRISHRLFSQECSVDIALPDGNHVRVKGFEHESVAQYWLEHEAKNFLRKCGHWLDMWPDSPPPCEEAGSRSNPGAGNFTAA